MQNSPAFKVPAALNERHSIPKRTSRAFPKLRAAIGTHHPFTVGRVKVNGRVIKGPAPLDHGRVVVGMRNRKATNSTERLHALDGLIVQQRHAVPQKISTMRLDEQGALSNRERRFGPDAEQIGPFSLDSIGMTFSQLIERGPLLPFPVNELPLVLANRATLWRPIRFAKLCATGDADIIVHSFAFAGRRRLLTKRQKNLSNCNRPANLDRKSTRLNSSHLVISYA